jgi:hypothetical protein
MLRVKGLQGDLRGESCGGSPDRLAENRRGGSREGNREDEREPAADERGFPVTLLF